MKNEVAWIKMNHKRQASYNVVISTPNKQCPLFVYKSHMADQN